MRKQLIGLGVVIVALGGALAWRVLAERAVAHAPSGGSGTIEGVEAFVSSRVPARLSEVLVQEGDSVTDGQVVAKLDCVEQEALLRAARARLEAAEASLLAAEASETGAKTGVGIAVSQVAAAKASLQALEAERELTERNQQRAANLRDSGAISGVSFDEIDTRLRGVSEQKQAAEANVRTASGRTAAAQASVSAAGAQVSAARATQLLAQAELERAELGVSECTLRAPRSGTVTARLHEPGAVVGPGTRILTIVDTRVAKVLFFLPNSELSRARIGAPAQVSVDAFPDRTFAGTIRRVAAEAEFTPRNVQTREDRDRLVYAVEVHVANEDGLLRSGMPCEVHLPGTER